MQTTFDLLKESFDETHFGDRLPALGGDIGDGLLKTRNKQKTNPGRQQIVYLAWEYLIRFMEGLQIIFCNHTPFVEKWTELHVGTNVINIKMNLRCQICGRKLHDLTLPLSNLYLVATGSIFEPHH